MTHQPWQGFWLIPRAGELMRQMMSNIDPQQLAAMSKASGQALSPEQVRHMLLIALGVVMRPGCDFRLAYLRQ